MTEISPRNLGLLRKYRPFIGKLCRATAPDDREIAWIFFVQDIRISSNGKPMLTIAWRVQGGNSPYRRTAVAVPAEDYILEEL